MLRTADKLLVLKEGRVAAFGERDRVLRALMQQPARHGPDTIEEDAGWGLPVTLEGQAGA
jgi:ABC-type protease/lipase transport system fused ATPase/permease subunit